MRVSSLVHIASLIFLLPIIYTMVVVSAWRKSVRGGGGGRSPLGAEISRAISHTSTRAKTHKCTRGTHTYTHTLLLHTNTGTHKHTHAHTHIKEVLYTCILFSYFNNILWINSQYYKSHLYQFCQQFQQVIDFIIIFP